MCGILAELYLYNIITKSLVLLEQMMFMFWPTTLHKHAWVWYANIPVLTGPCMDFCKLYHSDLVIHIVVVILVRYWKLNINVTTLSRSGLMLKNLLVEDWMSVKVSSYSALFTVRCGTLTQYHVKIWTWIW